MEQRSGTTLPIPWQLCCPLKVAGASPVQELPEAIASYAAQCVDAAPRLTLAQTEHLTVLWTVQPLDDNRAAAIKAAA
jgi:hypothetical protein